MVRVIEFGLVGALALAVLSFGGTHPLYFAAIQLLVLCLGVLLLFSSGGWTLAGGKLPIVVPLSLLLLVAFQLLPMPDSVVGWFRGTSEFSQPQSQATLSISPYQTGTQFLHLLTYILAFFLALVICQGSKAKRRFVVALLAIGLFEAFYGLVQYLTGWQQIFAYVKEFYTHEATGTYINRNHYAGLLAMLLPFAVALVFYHSGAGEDGRGLSRESKAARRRPSQQKAIFWLSAGIVLFTALIFSRSRMGIISAMTSLLVVFALMAASALGRRGGTALAAGFILLGLLLAIWIGPGPVLERFGHLEQEWAPSGANRLGIWRDTSELIKRSPVFGSGLGTFTTAYTQAQTVYLTRFVNAAHNDYLEFTVDLGLLGALLLFGSFFYVLRQSIRSFGIQDSCSRFDRAINLGCAGAIVALLLHSLTDFNLQIPANSLVFASILGLAWSSRADTHDGRARRKRP